MEQPTVLKFGGTSMDDEHTWRRVMDIIKRYDDPLVVVSATARTTRRLLEAAETAVGDLQGAMQLNEEIADRHRKLISNFLNHHNPGDRQQIQEACYRWIDDRMEELNRYLQSINRDQHLSPGIRDAVASTGEQLSSFLFARAAKVYGLNTRMIDAGTVIKTDAAFGRANPQMDQIGERAMVLAELISDGIIPIVGGYFGRNESGELTTLGFEGSDYTASILGSVLNAKAVEIWTDVSGIYTCDPRYVEQASPIPAMTFREATELAYFGAKVLHPATMKPAARQQIPVLVKNIFEPDHSGTWIGPEADSPTMVRAMTFLEDIAIVTVTSGEMLMGYEFLSGVFGILDRHHLTVDVVTTTEASVSIALKKGPGLEEAIEELNELGTTTTTDNKGLISLIGCSVDKTRDILQTVLQSVAKSEIAMISFSRSKQNLNIVMDEAELLDAVRLIHDSLFVITGAT
ncbi:MAG: aspartate kinase, partial [Balneolaceae bacterium]|nr:aspartate kinase [Balneolaceae bacterium]